MLLNSTININRFSNIYFVVYYILNTINSAFKFITYICFHIFNFFANIIKIYGYNQINL
uniref:Uncharacterized protein n=1 Tax=CrAss-like virus sp. ctYsL76 TaxID=2826826 RepID=A0A8S5QMS7_9CAUD|nr:MAG TPA: hypothetical protein [CrAss-like virus sp. ctYsL76]